MALVCSCCGRSSQTVRVRPTSVRVTRVTVDVRFISLNKYLQSYMNVDWWVSIILKIIYIIVVEMNSLLSLISMEQRYIIITIMVCQRHKRWTNIIPIFGQHLVFARFVIFWSAELFLQISAICCRHYSSIEPLPARACCTLPAHHSDILVGIHQWLLHPVSCFRKWGMMGEMFNHKPIVLSPSDISDNSLQCRPIIVPANTGHSSNAVSILVHRLRRWPNIETALDECPVFAEVVHRCWVNTFPVNTKHLYNICTMLDQRRRRWADVIQCYTNVLCLLFFFIFKDRCESLFYTIANLRESDDGFGFTWRDLNYKMSLRVYTKVKYQMHFRKD